MRVLPFLLAFAIGACASGPVATVEAQAVHIRPSLDGDLTFSRRADDVLQTVFANGSDRAVYFAVPSYFTVLEQQVGGGWAEQPSWYGITGQMPRPAAVGPGEYQPLVDLPLVDVAPGTYRIRAQVYEDAEWVRAVAPEERVSRPFVVVD